MDLLKTVMSEGTGTPSMEWLSDNYSNWVRLDGFWNDGSIHQSRCKYVQEKGLQMIHQNSSVNLIHDRVKSFKRLMISFPSTGNHVIRPKTTNG